MKRIVLAVALSLLASLASAQETYSINVGGTTTNRNSIIGMLELGRLQNNVDVCERGNAALAARTPPGTPIPTSCTQAQACTALGVTGGASCTATDAINARARIYPATTAGREAFVANEMIRTRAPDYFAEQIRRDTAAVAAFCAISQANRDALCSLLGLGAGCGACNQ